ncbi:hypothetical protein CTE05_01440 [Cellulomonas terrae]|uniref:Uncharacterized protein n=1 Tax=Cellulomonas terrae TaxID=311234 RepID=A0A511JF32_9CELL|nr:hypothetical protein CTE05_01440 [Cellulomonas terrae]
MRATVSASTTVPLPVCHVLRADVVVLMRAPQSSFRRATGAVSAFRRAHVPDEGRWSCVACDGPTCHTTALRASAQEVWANAPRTSGGVRERSLRRSAGLCALARAPERSDGPRAARYREA